MFNRETVDHIKLTETGNGFYRVYLKPAKNYTRAEITAKLESKSIINLKSKKK